MNEILKKQRFLIVFDLDGTLLTSEKVISEKSKEIIKELSELGNIITIASGRPARFVSKRIEELGFECPYICYNGSLIENKKDPSFKVYRRLIKKEIILDFLKHFGEDAFENVMFEDDVDQYYLRETDQYLNFFQREGMNVHLGSVIETLDKDMMSCVLQIKDQSRKDEMDAFINSLDSNMGVRWWADSDRFGEIHFFDNNKATSVLKLADYYNITREHIICFGDAMNDVQMIQMAGVSFAMLNADERLKKVATYITPYDNDHDGIYYALKNFFELN